MAVDGAPRHPSDTASVLSYRMSPADANLAGNVHGGWIMKLCDDVAAIAAMRHAGGRVVTASVDGMKFRAPVHVGDVVTLRGTVNAAWRTSMEVGVRVESEDVQAATVRHVCTAYLTMVALDEDERPAQVPPIVPATETERHRMEAATVRRGIRLAQLDKLHRVRV